MDALIKATFDQIVTVGSHVKDGHYGLEDSEGNPILPQDWQSRVNPGSTVSMYMWPSPELDSSLLRIKDPKTMPTDHAATSDTYRNAYPDVYRVLILLLLH
jgi:hypothetical protein